MSDYFDSSSNRIPTGSLARSAQVNNLRDEVGIGFDLLPTPDDIKHGKVTYGAESGVADAYVLTLTYVPTSYVEGMEISFEPGNDNTGASTVDVNSLGAVAIKRPDGTDLVAGDLVAGNPVVLRYTGSVFQFTGSAPQSMFTDAAADAAAAAASAAAAATSETNAAASESAAAGSASAASGSASAAAASETAAAASETAAAASEVNASNSAAAAATEVTYAEEWANKAEDSLVSVAAGGDGVDDYSALHHAAKAAASETAAAASETAAAASETAAAASETAAAASETAAAASETAAAASETAAANTLTTFQEQYWGPLASAPVDPEVGVGDLYFDTTDNEMKVYSNDLVWIKAGSAIEGLVQTESYTGTATSTAISTTYNVGQILVFVGGVFISPDASSGVYYEATNGTSITVYGTLAGDDITVQKFGSFVSADHYPHAEADLKEQNGINFKNKIINGGFDVWQRGTSAAVTTGGAYYAPDRWRNDAGGTVGAATLTREAFSIGQTDVPGSPKYFLRHDQTTASDAALSFLQQRVEDPQQFANKDMVLSFWAKAGAAKTLQAYVFDYDGTANSNDYYLDTFDLTTSWQKFTIPFTVGSQSNFVTTNIENGYLTIAFREASGFSTYTVDIAQVQLEEGPYATDFEQRPLTIEEMLCKRYACELISKTKINSSVGVGFCSNTTRAFVQVRFPVTMRLDTPTQTDSGTFRIRTSGGILTVTDIAVNRIDEFGAMLTIDVAAGYVSGESAFFEDNDASASLFFDAEL